MRRPRDRHPQIFTDLDVKREQGLHRPELFQRGAFERRLLPKSGLVHAFLRQMLEIDFRNDDLRLGMKAFRWNWSLRQTSKRGLKPAAG